MKVKRIRLVEDDEDDRDLFHNFFADRKDIRLLPTVGNGLELIDYLENAHSADDLPGLIILDQNMPKMNGKQTLKYLQSSTRFSKIPTVVYSTYTDSSLIIDCKKLGAFMVAVKPIDEDGYHKMMDDFLGLFSK